VQIYDGQLTTYLQEDTLVPTFTATVSSGDGGGSGGPRHTPATQVSLVVNGGNPMALGSNEIAVFVDDTHFAELQVDFLAEVVGRRIDDNSLEVVGTSGTFTVTNLCPPPDPPATQPELLVEAILGGPVEDFSRFGQSAPVGVPTDNPSSMVAPQVPIFDYTETFEVGSLVVDLDQQQLDAAFLGTGPTFPTGMTGELGYTIESVVPAPMVPGRYLLTWQCVLEDIPVASMQQTLQYAFLADRDSDSANNFQAMAPNDRDPVDDTDTWYLAQYDPFSGWFLSVIDAQGRPPGIIASGVRVIYYRQVQLFVIPITELGSADAILARWSTLAHDGNFGQLGAPWSADATPTVEAGPSPVSLAP
jgi:hypothetical protein